MENGPEMTRLLERLFDDPSRKLLNFGVTWGPEAGNVSAEERAAAINSALDQVDNGTAVEMLDIDGDEDTL